MAPKKPQQRTAEKPREKMAETAKNAGSVTAPDPEAPKGLRLRIPYVHRALELYGIDAMTWNVLISAVWPAARTPEAIMLALAYCKGRHLDPMKKMVHIVPVWDSKAPSGDPQKPGAFVETVWPSIAEIRVTASRTGCYGGKDAAIFGPDITEKLAEIDTRNDAVKEEVEITYPEWCRVDVYRIVQGIRCKFEGPKVYWKEAYATKSRWSPIPNEMWMDRKSGQLEKCAEAASLRAAFPEELGNEYAAEEMWGRRLPEHLPALALEAPLKDGEVRPPPVHDSEFKREPDPKPPAAAKPAETAKPKEEPKGDPRPVPPVDDAQQETVSHTVHENSAGAAAAVLDGFLDKSLERLKGETTIRGLTTLWDEVEAELPPDSRHLTLWQEACWARQNEIKAAAKK